MDTVDDALCAANVKYFPSDLLTPELFFNENVAYSIVIAYEDLSKGLIE